ncbi:MAG: signal transduction histidine kinase, LytS [Bacteroidetes bacterium]|jgi:tetratricopeptide (TPR) repeat protein|nr:signal transduction histidine kinase, LytS [Bacteroidota bacterium]
MKKVKRLLGIIVLLVPFVLFSQNETDSLLYQLRASKNDTNKVILLNKLARLSAFSEPVKSIGYAQKADSLATFLHYSSGIITAQRYLARTANILGKTDLAFKHLEQALQLARKTKNKYGEGATLNDLGSVHEESGELGKALDNYYEALRLFEQTGNEYGVGIVKLSIAKVGSKQGDYKNELKLAQEAKEIFQRLGDRGSESVALLVSATAYKDMEQHTLASLTYLQALQIADELGNIERKSEALNGLGTVYQEMEQFDKAISYYKQSLAIDDSIGNLSNVAISYANLGGVYYLTNNKRESKYYFDKARALAQETGDLYNLMSIMLNSSRVYYTNGDFVMAYEYRNQYDQLRDSLYSEKKNEQLIRIRELYETEKKIQEIARLKSESEAIRAKAALNRTLLFAFIGLLLLVLVSIFFYLKHRKTREQQKRIELEQKALRSQMNPHFIFNCLNSIQRMFIEGNYDLANEYMGDFGSLLRTILENSGKPSISLKDELDTLKLYLDLEIMRMGGTISYTFDIDPDLDLQNNFVPPLIIQPFVENAIWHGILPKGEKGRIEINLKKHSARLLHCTITDDGIGIEQSKKQKRSGIHTSKGMKITEERLGLLNAVSAAELPSGGTKITLIIPLNK